MSKSMHNLAASLQILEAEIGVEQLSQLLAEMLLACSSRMVGDSTNNWSVKTGFVNGEVTAITDKSLSSIGGF